LNRVANSYRFSARPLNRVAISQNGPASVLRVQATTFDGIARGAIAFVPSWIYLGMILLAASAICVTVNLRGSAEAKTAARQLQQLTTDIDAMRKSNARLELQVRQISTDPAIIESAARLRLGMVRPTDIVVPIKSQSGNNLATLSFVR
jgi:cell division protein FtsB